MSPADDFPARLAALLKERGLSYRKLAAATREADPRGKGLHYAFLGDVVRRRETASPQTVELVARALGLPPASFAEYRLALIRRVFDERSVALDEAIDHAEELQQLLAANPRARLARELLPDLETKEPLREPRLDQRLRGSDVSAAGPEPH